MNERMETSDTIENFSQIYKLDTEVRLDVSKVKYQISLYFAEIYYDFYIS